MQIGFRAVQVDHAAADAADEADAAAVVVAG